MLLICLTVHPNEKFKALKRKLSEDRKVDYEKCIRLESEKKEKKRLRDRLRYHEKKNQKTSKITDSNNQDISSCRKTELSQISHSYAQNTKSGKKG